MAVEAIDWGRVVVGPLAGAFAGAGLAFALNWIAKQRDENRDDVTAGNLALFKLAAQASDHHILRATLREQFARKLKDGDVPDWALANPIMFTIEEGSGFDYEALAFLLDNEDGRKALVWLKVSHRTHLDLKALFDRYNDSTQELQKGSVPVVRSKPGGTFKDMEDHLGPELIARVESQQKALVLRAELNPAEYERAFRTLKNELLSRFGEKVWATLTAEPTEKFAEKNLPALPESLRKRLEGKS